MVSRIRSVAFEGIETVTIDVEVQISNGLPAFQIVGLPDKAVAESRERVRGALHSLGLSLPAKRITINLAPADLAKDGAHFDLPIALGLLNAMEILPDEVANDYLALGELSLDAGIRSVSGVLPAAIHAMAAGQNIICPKECGEEALWAGDLDILAPNHLLEIINHFKGSQVLSKPAASNDNTSKRYKYTDLMDVKGQESAKRALEIAAAGGHTLLMVGPPGSGKSMMASCLPGILPPLTPKEALEVSMIHSLAGTLPEGGLMRERPFRDPHHSASQPALIGGGQKVKPGEVSLAHHGVLFMDELPEFARGPLEALRQPLETGQVLVSRVNSRAVFPAGFQLVAAMNPCRCGYLGDSAQECTRAPKCGLEYQNKLSGPLLDRFDLVIEVPPVSIQDLQNTGNKAESSDFVRKRVVAARNLQQNRYATRDDIAANAQAKDEMLENNTQMDEDTRAYYMKAAEKMKLSARGYTRVLRVARTIADLSGREGRDIIKADIAEALSYRRHGLRS